MKKLLPFKDVQLQWLRLLLLDTELSARAFQFATYLAVCRCNKEPGPDEGKAWPSHSRVCKDLGLTNEKTIQRLIKELDGKWFDIKRGNGLKHTTEYVPTKATQLAAQELREQEEAEKPDNIVRLQDAKGRHFCSRTRTNLSSEPRQKCPPKKEKEKTKEKDVFASDLPNGGQSGPPRQCPVRTLFVVRADEAEKITAWDQWLCDNGFPPLHGLSIQGSDASGNGYLMPRRWVPSSEEDQSMVRRYVRWALSNQYGQTAYFEAKDSPAQFSVKARPQIVQGAGL